MSDVSAAVRSDAAVLVESGTETADGRMSKAALLGLIVSQGETAIVVVDHLQDVVLFNERALELGMIRDHIVDEAIWAAVQPIFSRPEATDKHSEAHTHEFEFTPPHTTGGFISTARATSRPAAAVRCVTRLVGSDDLGIGNQDNVERYAVLYGSDDTDNVRLEATRRDFVANVSHELKTPVGAIGLLTEALLQSADDQESVDYFGERVLVEVGRMSRMVSELIALSRLQGAEKLAEMEVVDVDSLVDDALQHGQVSAEAAGIDLRGDEPSGLCVTGDRSLLLMALDNLVANAIAYSSADTIVSVSRRVIREGDRELVAIAVTDRGIGIAARDQQRVFERFFRVDKARSRDTGGTGLGLAIVKHVAANHDGSIRLWSKPGTGSTFTLSIPRAVPALRNPDDQIAPEQVRQPAQSPGSHGRSHVHRKKEVSR
ncbi:sensor histidine kinase [Williamsia sterculiae]